MPGPCFNCDGEVDSDTGILTIRVDLKKRYGSSKSGKSVGIASTFGPKSLREVYPGGEKLSGWLMMSITIYEKKNPLLRKARAAARVDIDPLSVENKDYWKDSRVGELGIGKRERP